MSVLIKGMGIPVNCNKCVFCVNGFTDAAPMYECAASGDDMTSVLVDDHGKPFDFRPDWCPLIEVETPHGRLIDADALLNKTFYDPLSPPYITKEMVWDEKTVVEAERSE